MKNFARLSGLVAALCLGLTASVFGHDSHGGGGGWHGHYNCGPHFHYGGYFPFFAPLPVFAFSSAPYYYDGYYGGPSVGVSVTGGPSYYGEGGYHSSARAEDHGEDLGVDVQRALRRDGYYHGSIDGEIGSGTRAAIRQYQYDHHLEVTGRIDRSLVHSLALD
jgi:hypothetical protein